VGAAAEADAEPVVASARAHLARWWPALV
jgi:hypothetical protein